MKHTTPSVEITVSLRFKPVIRTILCLIRVYLASKFRTPKPLQEAVSNEIILDNRPLANILSMASYRAKGK